MTGAYPVRVPGHFGELLQGRVGAAGPVALISLPCPVLAVTGVTVAPGGLAIHMPGPRSLSRAQARALLRRLDLRAPGRVVLRADMPAGGGAGSSTAALVALAGLAGWTGRPQVLARACIAVEGASDPLMFPAPERRLWASRRGICLGILPPLPRIEVIGGFFGPPRRTDAADAVFPRIDDLLDPWRDAAGRGDVNGIATLAATSAARTLAHRGVTGDPTAALARDLGAPGWVIAHTGSARGLIFAPGRVPDRATAALRAAGMTGIVRFRVGGER